MTFLGLIPNPSDMPFGGQIEFLHLLHLHSNASEAKTRGKVMAKAPDRKMVT